MTSMAFMDAIKPNRQVEDMQFYINEEYKSCDYMLAPMTLDYYNNTTYKDAGWNDTSAWQDLNYDYT